MISPSRRAFLLLSSLAAGAPVVRGQLALCPDCGREARAGDAACRGCGKALGNPSVNPAPVEASPEPDTTAAPLDLASVEREAAEARAAWKKKDALRAILFAGNTLALHGLSREKKDGLDMEMENLRRQAVAATATRALPCPVCKGEGTRLELAITMKGEAKRLQGPNQLCLACAGVKTVPGQPVDDDLRAARAAALTEFADLEKRRGLRLEHGAWVPEGFDAAVLPVRSLARLKRTTSAPCTSCVGLGRQACASCKGLGLLACTDRDCVSGKVVCPTCDGRKVEELEVGAQKAVRTCRTCQGRGIAACETCAGKGLLTCRRCEGAKAVTCRDCDGAGLPVDCRRCHGEGIMPCTRCKGSGDYKGKPCETCHGAKEILCSTCGGAGRKD